VNVIVVDDIFFSRIEDIQMSDVLFYSNHCRFCPRVLDFITKNNLIDRIQCICLDKRQRNPENGATYAFLDNGASYMIPPNVNCVPALMQMSNKRAVVTGDEIVAYLKSKFSPNMHNDARANGEPIGIAPGAAFDSFSSYSDFGGGASISGGSAFSGGGSAFSGGGSAFSGGGSAFSGGGSAFNSSPFSGGQSQGSAFNSSPFSGGQSLISGSDDRYGSGKMSSDSAASALAAFEKQRNADMPNDNRGGFMY
jgi:hypothetical protein